MNTQGVQWLKSPGWDAFWIFSGFWLLVLVGVLQSGIAIKPLYLIFVFCFWLSHRFMSMYVVFSLPAFTGLVANNKWRFIVLPVLITVLVFGFLSVPETVIPMPKFTRLFVLWSFDYFLNLYHFSVQNYGVICIYDLKAGAVGSNIYRKYDKIYCLIVGVFFIIIAEVIQGTFFFEETIKSYFGGKLEIVSYFPAMKSVSVIVIIALFFGLVYVQRRLHRMSWVKGLYLFHITAVILSAFFLDPFSFLFVWSVQHWLAAIGLGLIMIDRHSDVAAKESSHSVVSIRNKTTLYLLLFFVISLCLTPIFQVEAMSEDLRLVEKWMPTFLQLLENNHVLMLFFSIGMSTALVHYLMDRSIFRLSHAQTRNITLPLLMGSEISRK